MAAPISCRGVSVVLPPIFSCLAAASAAAAGPAALRLCCMYWGGASSLSRMMESIFTIQGTRRPRDMDRIQGGRPSEWPAHPGSNHRSPSSLNQPIGRGASIDGSAEGAIDRSTQRKGGACQLGVARIVSAPSPASTARHRRRPPPRTPNARPARVLSRSPSRSLPTTSASTLPGVWVCARASHGRVRSPGLRARGCVGSNS